MSTKPTDQVSADPLSGQKIDGRWQIDRQIGAGGMSRVYLGWAIKTGTPLAIKIIEYGADPALRLRSINEARAMMTLRSSHIVHALDVGELASGQLYIVMEYLDGKTLDAELKQCGPLPWARVIHMGLQICQGLATAHRQNIIHRDIKPQNCVLTVVDGDPDHVTLIDFGIARDLTSEATLTQQGFLIGTPEYIAPEIIRGSSKANALTDIYALGTTLYKLLTGSTPFQGPNKLAVIEAHLETEIPPPSQCAPAMRIPAAVDAIVVRALAKEPSARFQSAEAFAQALRDVLQSPSTSRPPFIRPDVTPPPREAPVATKAAAPTVPRERGETAAPVGSPRRPVSWRVQRLRALIIAGTVVGFAVAARFVQPAVANDPPVPVASSPKPVAEANSGRKIERSSDEPVVSTPPTPEKPAPQPQDEPVPPPSPAPVPLGEAGPSEPPEQPRSAPNETQSPPPVVPPAAPSPEPEPSFAYAEAKKNIDEQQNYMRATCLARAKKPTTSVKIQVHVRASGRPTALVIHSDPAVRECIRDLFKGFNFDPSPRGGSLEYNLTLTGATLRRLPPDPRYVK